MSNPVDRVADRGGDALLLIGRILIAVLFVRAGWGHISDLSGFATSLADMGLPASYFVAVIAACVALFGPICVILGLATRYAALLLALFTLAAALLAHRYWALPPQEQMGQSNNFFKNVAIVGGLLVLFVAGPGRFSIDHRGS
jgi:putative oxidoreductase